MSLSEIAKRQSYIKGLPFSFRHEMSLRIRDRGFWAFLKHRNNGKT